MWQPFPLIKSLTPCNVSYFPVDCLLHSSSLVVIFVHQFFFLSEMSVIRLWCRKSLREYLKIKSKSVIPFEKSGGFLFYSINHPPLTYPPPPTSFLSLSPHPHFPRLSCSFWPLKGLGEELFLDALLKMHRCLHRCGITRVFIATLCLKSSEIFGEMGSFSK